MRKVFDVYELVCLCDTGTNTHIHTLDWNKIKETENKNNIQTFSQKGFIDVSV